MLRIKQLREEFGISQLDFAKKINVTQQSISLYEKGEREPSLDVLTSMANFFGVSIDYLMCKTDIRNPGKQIDDVLNEAMIGMSKEEYENLTETQKKQIRDFALFVKNQNEEKK